MWFSDLTLRLRAFFSGAVPGPFNDHATLTDGLVSYWALDETSGVRYDSVTDSANDLTDNNTVGVKPAGPSGVASSYVSANNEYLSCASNTNLDGADTDYTVAFWLKTTPTTQSGLVVRGGDGADWATWVSAAGLIRYENHSFWGEVNSPAAVNDGLWHYIVCWHDATANTLNIKVDNGATTSAGDGGAYAPGVAEFRIGRPASAGTNLDGQMARVAKWNRLLETAEFASLYNSGNGKSYADLTAAEKVSLVSYWNLDEVSGTRADSHGANDLTDNNTVTSSASGPSGTVASFNGTDEFLSVADNSSFNFAGGSFAINFWCKDTAPFCTAGSRGFSGSRA